jgi:hypothetical protein
MSNIHSPFHVIQNFISPLQCEEIIDALDCVEPDTDSEDYAVLNTRRNDDAEELIFDTLQDYSDDVIKRYDIKDIRGVEQVTFEWYPHGCAATSPHCESSTYVKSQSGGGKWVKNRDRDLTGILFLSEYNDKVPFDSDYEVYGGKLEFPQHAFGFNPQRGTLILFPSGPHFINLVSDIHYGDMFAARFHIAGAEPLMYDAKNFPGTFETWLQEFA